MNWVGGARSRLKVPNERKVQRDYFERKRLATKVNRGQILNQAKGPISKDLLFLSKAASTTKTDGLNKSPMRQAPKRVNLDSCAKIPLRDIELPMSPIEKPSTLELMDTRTILSNSSLDHSFYRSSMDTVDLPKVSTMKVPSFKGIDAGLKREAGSSRDETGANILDVSCMTEALFPAVKPTISQKEPVKADTFKSGRRQPSKKYSIDDLLNASKIKDSFFPKPQKKDDGQFPSKVVPRHADELLWSKDGTVFGGVSRKRPAVSDFDDHNAHPKRKAAIEKNQGFGSYFGDWVAHTRRTKGVFQAAKKSKVDVVVDKDAMLEFHYIQTQDKNHDDVPLLLPKARDMPAPRKEKEPCNSSLLLTENPFSKRDVYIKNKAHSNVRSEIPVENTVRRKEPHTSISSHNRTLFNESILGPIVDKKMPHKGSDDKEMGKRSTAFEQMMTSFEYEERHQSGSKHRDVEDVVVGIGETDHLEAETRSKLVEDRQMIKQHNQWKDFVSGKSIKSTLDKSNGGIDLKHPKPPCLQSLTELKNNKKMNCSVFEELLCLEQEAFMGLDSCSQELTLSPIDFSEDPIMRRVPDMTDKVARKTCPFDSSQESSLTAKSQSQSLPTTQVRDECKESTSKQQEVPSMGSCSAQTEQTIPIPCFERNSGGDEDHTGDDVAKHTQNSVHSLHTTQENVICRDITQKSPVFKEESTSTNDQISNPSSTKLVVATATQASLEDIISPPTMDKEQQTCDSVLVPSPAAVNSPMISDGEDYSHSNKQSKMEPPDIDTAAEIEEGNTKTAVKNCDSSQIELAGKDLTSTACNQRDVSVQTGISCSKEITSLTQEVEKLQEKLKTAESMIIWQSLMMRIQNI